mmetsp:Transcript_92769/g.233757  ORF Transcript_92769/g.233757 Transcript_92769/m.233757 type:complete len:321 (-) Transcript_92769:141-1103(-)
MDLPGGNPADAIKAIQKEMQDAFDEAGMNKVEEMTDMLDELLDTVKKGPGSLIDSAKGQFEDMKNKLENAAKDPASLAGGGAVAMCASYYANSVMSKLKAISGDVQNTVTGLTDTAGASAEPLKKVVDGMESAMGQIEAAIKGLAKLPKQVTQEFQGKDSPDDIAQVDTANLKKALDSGDVGQPLDTIKGLGSFISEAVEAIKKGMAALMDFVQAAPDQIKDAFASPMPLCCFSVTPQPMKDLLDMVENLAKIDFGPIIDTLNKAVESITGLDVEAVKAPMAAFKEKAGGLVDKLDKTVQAAKMASGGGAVGGALKGLMG